MRKWEYCSASDSLCVMPNFPMVLGMTYSECQHDLQSLYVFRGEFVKEH
uniref:Uncharacterized protein n=1 Tax=Apteryx owenii TaxID=8824 RepID=A0A8B9NNR0_APTOW